MSQIDLTKVPEHVQIELCTMAIICTAEAQKTPEGRAAIERGKQAYLEHLQHKTS